MAATGQVDAVAFENDAFGGKTEALFETGFAGEPDDAVGTDHAMPGHGRRAAQSPDYLARATGVSGSGGDIAISGDFSRRDFRNGLEHFAEHES